MTLNFGRLFAVLLGGLALAVSIPCQAGDSSLDAIKKAKVIKVAVPQDFPPFGSVGPDMRPLGYDIDAAQAIADDIGVGLELVPVTSTNRVPYLTTGKADLIISSLGKNPDREKVIDFSIAYAPFYSAVFGPADALIKTAADLAGKTVAITRGSVEDLELAKVIPDSVDVRRFEDNSSTISAYLTGQVQFVATGNVVAAAINEQNPAKALETKFMIKNSPCYVGLNKSQPELLAAVNNAIAAAKKDGRLEAIARKWLKIGLPADL